MRLPSANSELARALREEIRRTYLLGYVVGSDGRRYEIFADCITPERAAFVESACSFARPTATLEIGMAWGMSTLGILSTLCESARDFRPHVVIDPWQSARYRQAALLSLRRAGADALIEFHHKASVAVLPSFQGGRLISCSWTAPTIIQPSSATSGYSIRFLGRAQLWSLTMCGLTTFGARAGSLKTIWATNFTVNIRPTVNSPCSELT
jgi:hypothetical protein